MLHQLRNCKQRRHIFTARSVYNSEASHCWAVQWLPSTLSGLQDDLGFIDCNKHCDNRPVSESQVNIATLRRQTKWTVFSSPFEYFYYSSTLAILAAWKRDGPKLACPCMIPTSNLQLGMAYPLQEVTFQESPASICECSLASRNEAAGSRRIQALPTHLSIKSIKSKQCHGGRHSKSTHKIRKAKCRVGMSQHPCKHVRVWPWRCLRLREYYRDARFYLVSPMCDLYLHRHIGVSCTGLYVKLEVLQKYTSPLPFTLTVKSRVSEKRSSSSWP